VEIRRDVLYSRRSFMKPAKIFPIILAAGSSRSLPFPKALAPFEGKTALEIALANCTGLERPIVVLGARAAKVKKYVPGRVHCIVNHRWRRGQLSSLLAALRHVPRDGAFLVYPVDLPLISRDIVRRLVAQFRRCQMYPSLVMPVFQGRLGHPAIFSADLRKELAHAETAREVAYRDSQRICKVPVRTAAIWTDFSTPREYARCLRLFHRDDVTAS
jgi:molybdenum cofactor cytidylyltransferase